MKAYIYIIKCSDDSYYIGSTTRLKERFLEHASGNGAVHTMKRLPLELVYYERCENLNTAQLREKEIKGWSRKKKEHLITSKQWQSIFQIAVYAIIQDKSGNVLLMRHTDKGDFMLPGGGVESNESLEVALKREVREEISANIEDSELVIIHQKVEKNQMIFVYKSHLIDIDFKQNNEAAEIKCFDPHQLPKNIANSSKTRIEHYINNSTYPIILTE